MRTKLAVWIMVFLMLAGRPLMAHHSPGVEFDMGRSFTVTGVVTKVEWMNPHIWFYVDVKDENGKVTNWAFQGGPPAFLVRAGWSKNALKPGDQVTVQGFPAKDGSNNATSRSVTLPDGKKVFAGQQN